MWQVMTQIASGTFDTENELWAEHISKEAKDLIKHLLEPDPNLRWTAEQALQHAWLKGGAKHKPLPDIHAFRLRGYRILRLLRQGMLLLDVDLDFFAVFDTNHDGFISRQELDNALCVVFVFGLIPCTKKITRVWVGCCGRFV